MIEHDSFRALFLHRGPFFDSSQIWWVCRPGLPLAGGFAELSDHSSIDWSDVFECLRFPSKVVNSLVHMISYVFIWFHMFSWWKFSQRWDFLMVEDSNGSNMVPWTHGKLGYSWSGWCCNQHLEKYEYCKSMGRMTSHIWNGKKCSSVEIMTL